MLPGEAVASLRDLAAGAARGGLTGVVSGERGVGKTLAVQTCAEQLRLDTWRVDCGILVERYGEAAASQLPTLFEAGERPHAVLLFHDAEWLFERIAGDTAARLLELAAARRPPTILETSRPDPVARGLAALDLAHVTLPFPDVPMRAELWRRLAWRAHPLLVPDVSVLAAVRVPGATIERAIDRALEAALDASGERLPSTDDLLRALDQVRST